MGNQSSVPTTTTITESESIHNNTTSPLPETNKDGDHHDDTNDTRTSTSTSNCDKEEEEEDVLPEAYDANSTTSNASSCSSSSSSSSEDFEANDDTDHAAEALNNHSNVKTNPYVDTTPKKKTTPAPTTRRSSSSASSGNNSNSKNAEECYRLPIFQRKSSPLMTVLHSTGTGDDDDEDDDDDDNILNRTSTCFPAARSSSNANSSDLALTSSINSNATPLSASSATATASAIATATAAALSFQSCTLRTNDSDDNIMIDDNAAAAAASSSSSILGCVGSPIGSMSNSNSWTNLMGLEGVENSNTALAYTAEEMEMVDGDLPTVESDLSSSSSGGGHGRPREYWIVTTAALPWMTGTAVNPLLRAAYLSQRNRCQQEQQQQHQQQNDDDEIETPPPPTLSSTVTLVLPWLEVAEDRLALYGKDWEDATPQIQEDYIRTWLRDSAQMPQEADLNQGGIMIQWYPARYHQTLSSIFAMGDLCELIPSTSMARNMICILEEPEHVNCYRAPGRESWRDKFPHVIGIVHTNYKAYAQNHYSGLLTGPLVGALSSLMVRAYCDKVVKLSPVLQSYAPYKEVVSNVHGIRQEFFQVPQNPGASRIYFIGKLLWAKGLDKLLELEASYRKATGSYFAVDIYGSGPHEGEIQKAFLGQEYFSAASFFKNNKASSSSSSASSFSSLKDVGATPSASGEQQQHQHQQQQQQDNSAAKRYWRSFRQPIPARFLGRMDHAQVGATGEYKIFVNPSITEVLCTTTAEACAMGFWVLIPKHSSNEFFLPFGNCLQYSNRREFVELLQYCQTHDPPGWCCTTSTTTTTTTSDGVGGNANGEQEDEVLVVDRSSEALFGALSWQAATDRLIETAFLSRRDARRCERLQPKDRNIQEWHYALGRGTRGDVLRKVLGGGPVADQSQYAAANTSNSNSNSNSSNKLSSHAVRSTSITVRGSSSSSLSSSSSSSSFSRTPEDDPVHFIAKSELVN